MAHEAYLVGVHQTGENRSRTSCGIQDSGDHETQVRRVVDDVVLVQSGIRRIGVRVRGSSDDESGRGPVGEYALICGDREVVSLGEHEKRVRTASRLGYEPVATLGSGVPEHRRQDAAGAAGRSRGLDDVQARGRDRVGPHGGDRGSGGSSGARSRPRPRCRPWNGISASRGRHHDESAHGETQDPCCAAIEQRASLEVPRHPVAQRTVRRAGPSGTDESGSSRTWR